MIQFSKTAIPVLLLLINIAALSSNPDTRTFRISKNLSVYNAIFRELDAFYVDTINYDKLNSTAINHLLRQLDPYTVFIPENETDNLKFMTTGEYAGIGALITKFDNKIYVSELYEGMPAHRNDVRVGDVILEVDGVVVQNQNTAQVSAMLKGTPSTSVRLKLTRMGESKPLKKEFLREKIFVNPIDFSAVLSSKIGYAHLSDFTDKSASELKKVIVDFEKHQRIESMIIDLRNNGGGLIDEAVKIMGFFVPKGSKVVSTKGKSEFTERVYKTTTEPLFPNIKLVILVNGSSASASEILAGAVQDLDRGIVIGERTFGKGLVQNIRPVGHGGLLKMTTAKYYMPSGRCVQAIDYTHKSENGSATRVPDSLTTVFKTSNGRLVRNGGGVLPDIVIADKRKMNIAHYLFLQNRYFEFANDFVLKNKRIAKPSEFALSDQDFESFLQFLVDKKFSYETETEKMYRELQKLAADEGLDIYASDEFKALEQKLKPDIARNIADNRNDVVELLSLEIIKRFYFQRGEIEFSLRSDPELKEAIRTLTEEHVYETLLMPPNQISITK